MSEMMINYMHGEYTLCNNRGENVQMLSVGQSFELKLHGEWCRVRLESGGYKGRYYSTAAGERGRLAVCMKARMCQLMHVEETEAMSLDPIKDNSHKYTGE